MSAGNEKEQWMKRPTLRKWMAPVAAAGVVATMPAEAQAPELAMLDSLKKGNWELRIDGARTNICTRTGRELIQVRHRRSTCTHYAVRDEADQVIVQ